MESTGPVEKSSEPPSHRWANIFGTLIAVLTLAIPGLAIAYYSSHNSTESLSSSPYLSQEPITDVIDYKFR